MPFYTFKCPLCDDEKEVLQSMNSAKPVCEQCAKASCSKTLVEMERVFRNTGKPQFKGSGFYETDYKDKSK
jgi:putative FmdB family regulatory protein